MMLPLLVALAAMPTGWLVGEGRLMAVDAPARVLVVRAYWPERRVARLRVPLEDGREDTIPLWEARLDYHRGTSCRYVVAVAWRSVPLPPGQLGRPTEAVNQLDWQSVDRMLEPRDWRLQWR